MAGQILVSGLVTGTPKLELFLHVYGKMTQNLIFQTIGLAGLLGLWYTRKDSTGTSFAFALEVHRSIALG